MNLSLKLHPIVRTTRNMFNKRIWIFLILVYFSSNVFAQDFAYEAALNACECLQNSKKDLTQDVQVECISNALAKQTVSTAPSEREFISSQQGILSMMDKINEILTVICFENGKKAFQDLEKKYYVDSEDEVAQSYYFTTQLMMNDGKYDLAVEGLEIATDIDSNFVMAFDHLGVSYRQIEEYTKSIDAYKQSLKIFPLGKMALMNLGVVYSFVGDLENSNKYYGRLVRAFPEHAEGYYGIGKNYIILKEYELGLDNIYKAHIIYVKEMSDYQSDSEQLISLVFNILKEEGEEKLMKKLAKKYNIVIE